MTFHSFFLSFQNAALDIYIFCEETGISRLQQIHLIIDEVSGISKTLASSYEPSLAPFIPPFDRLLYEFPEEYTQYALDEVVVGAVGPVVSSLSLLAPFFSSMIETGCSWNQFRRLVASWEPLKASSELLDSLRPWKKAFRFSDAEKDEDRSVDIYGQGRVRKPRRVENL